MIYLFSCFKKDRSGEKMVAAFRVFPKWQDIQQAADADAGALNFFGMKQTLANLETNFAETGNTFSAWEYGEFQCTFFALDLIDNAPKSPIPLSEIVKQVRGGDPPVPLRAFA